VADAFAVKVNIGLGVDGHAVDGLGGHGGCFKRAGQSRINGKGRLWTPLTVNRINILGALVGGPIMFARVFQRQRPSLRL
jgi:hypothetical protein